jgi:hypothetical protein
MEKWWGTNTRTLEERRSTNAGSMEKRWGANTSTLVI